MTAPPKNPEIERPEPGRREHFNVTLFGEDRFVYVNESKELPAIMVDELALFPNMCIAWGPEARGNYFVGRRVGRETTVEQLTQMPDTVRLITQELLTQYSEPPTL
ncbi:MAG: hypothetical protein WAS36_01915 [Candidatus Saccharimonadales bacterium]